MADYELKGYQESAKFHLAQVAGNFVIPSESFSFYQSTRKVCDAFLTLAAASLLADFKVEFFFSNMARSAANWKNYLLCHSGMYKTPAPVRYDAPYYASVISGDTDLVKALLNSLDREPIPVDESKSTLCKLRLMLQIASSKTAHEKLEKQYLEAFVESDGDDISVTLFTALIDDSEVTEGEFWEAFESAIYEHEEQLALKMGAVATRIERFIPHRYLWLEGICWLRIAVARGFTLPSSGIHYCPDEALLTAPKAYAGDWQVIQQDLSAHQID